MTVTVEERVGSRFTALRAQYDRFTWDHRDHHNITARPEEWRRWASSAMHLIGIVFGETSSHYTNFKTAYEHCRNYDFEVRQMYGVFLGAFDDWSAGLSETIESVVSAEVLGDFVAMAKMALDNGHKDVAAVLACAALEGTLKRYGRSHDVDVEGKSLQDVVGALKARGLVSGAAKSLLDVMPKIRDYAMHANWGKIQDTDVRSVIGYVEQLLLTRLG